MALRFAVIGAGRQGAAAAYDLRRFAPEAELLVADLSLAEARRTADRVDGLAGSRRSQAFELDASDEDGVAAWLAGHRVSVALSCAPYRLHEMVERAAIRAGVSAVDMGNDTDVTLETLAMDDVARRQGVTVVPDCGLAPGLVNSLAAYIIERLGEVDRIRLYCGGLPQQPKGPLRYALAFSVQGLVGEYQDVAIALRAGEVARLETLAELETLVIEPLGELEAFTTSGGASTAPYTLKGRVRDYEYKTLRYPGHCAILRAFRHYGFWDHEAVEVDGVAVKPVELFYRLMDERLRDPDHRDLVVARATGDGPGGSMTLDLIDRMDPETGFTAMERLTGFSTAIVAQAVASGEVRKGCVPYEQAMTGARFLEELARRGIVPRVLEEARA
jgi:lysine 6-dehydrogenase